ncbi:hypothetical protein BDA99DRAFT_557394 [Phascolomyces articulosus]|uniref:MULE transposase domain-containing protein n=1 Tax=Phascolomyces articulosus TaxID=60185 RepID=A0AAD5PGB5_9FUNG|nr:hypothetical protein BDA99DRAFT_557394 [Phascolomyces articulosus]
MDDDHVLTKALHENYASVPHILCDWHIKKNLSGKILQHVKLSGKPAEDEENEFKIVMKMVVDNLLYTRKSVDFNEAVKNFISEVKKSIVSEYDTNDRRLEKQVANLHHKISQFAIYKTIEELLAVQGLTNETITCNPSLCSVKWNFDLPCRYILYSLKKGTPLYPELYSKRWWIARQTAIIPSDPVTEEEDCNMNYDDTQPFNWYQQLKEKIASTFMSYKNNQQRHEMIDILEAALSKLNLVPMENIELPKSITTKGRPTKKAIGSRFHRNLQLEGSKLKLMAGVVIGASIRRSNAKNEGWRDSKTSLS